MTEEEILNLTPKKLKARLTDIFEMFGHLEGPKEKQGRIVRERREELQKRVSDKGVRPPENIKS